jgi:hypothetical protein
LQEFTPVQCTVAVVSAATDTLANPDVNNIAAAAAIAAFDTLLICMCLTPQQLFDVDAAKLLLPYQDPASAGIITQLYELMYISVFAIVGRIRAGAVLE